MCILCAKLSAKCSVCASLGVCTIHVTVERERKLRFDDLKYLTHYLAVSLKLGLGPWKLEET